MADVEAPNPSEGQPTGNQPTESQPTGSQPTGSQSNGSQSNGSQKKESIFNQFRSGLVDKLKGPMGLLSSNPTTLRNLIISVVTVGLEILLNKELFSCPLEDHAFYAWMFIIAPFPILFCANVLIIGQIWKLTTRCHFTKYQRRGDVFARLIPNIIKALVGPCVWLVASFADTDYYVCATVGPDAVKRNLTNAANITALEKEMDAARSNSHLRAWIIFITMVIVCTVTIVVKKCCLKDVLLENDYEYERREAVQALKTFRKYIRGLTDEDKQGDEEATSSENKHDDAGKKEDDGGEKSEGLVWKDSEGVILWPNGIPELIGQKEVEKMFEGWTNKDKGKDKDKDKAWSYAEARRKFEAKYPRAATGDPGDPWRAHPKDVLLENDYEYERREAVQALKTFRKYIRGLTDEDKQGDEEATSSENKHDDAGKKEDDGGEKSEGLVWKDSEGVMLWPNGIPELIGQKEVEKMFEGWTNKDKDKGKDKDKDKAWSYAEARRKFEAKYPRAATGDPGDPWKAHLETSTASSFINHSSPQEGVQRAAGTSDGSTNHSPSGSVSISREELGSFNYTDHHRHEGDALIS